MSDRAHRMFQIIQFLRTARGPVTARTLADRVEVTPRTIYRDVVTLQAAGVPIEGAAGLGYVMQAGYDLPPLMFSAEEIEALTVGLALVGRTADAALVAAAALAAAKIREVLPAARPARPALLVSQWNAVPASGADYGLLRLAIRDERKLGVLYTDAEDRTTDRTVWPLALIYYVDNALLAGWCELRGDFRHFRVDRIASCRGLDERFTGQGTQLRLNWQSQHGAVAV